MLYLLKIYRIGAVFCSYFLFIILGIYCSKQVDSTNTEAVMLLFSNLSSISDNKDPNGNSSNTWQFSNVFLFDTITEAPGATGTGFGDPNRAINGIRGCGKTCGSTDVYSLEKSSSSTYCIPDENCLVLEIQNKKILNGPGIDFVVFENPFCIGGEANCSTSRFMEPVIVEVSSSGTDWCGWNPQYIGADTSNINLRNPNNWQRFAGIEPVLFNQDNWKYTEEDIFDKTKAGGDGFDLEDTNFGYGCSNTEKQNIIYNGFVYLRLTSAFSRGFTYPTDSFDKKPDIDGAIAKYVIYR